jgi:hypothetical protein
VESEEEEDDPEDGEDEEDDDDDDEDEELSFTGAGIILFSILGTPRFPSKPERLSSKGNFVEGTNTSPTLTS